MIESSLEVYFVAQFLAPDMELFLLCLTLLLGVRYLCEFIEHVMVQVCSTEV